MNQTPHVISLICRRNYGNIRIDITTNVDKAITKAGIVIDRLVFGWGKAVILYIEQ
jgi:hypothetical protein